MGVPVQVSMSLPMPGGMEENIALAVWAEEQGFPGVWLADVGGLDAFILATAVALRTSSIRIGTAVIPAYTRTPAVFASTVMSLSQVAAGRFVLGLGSSSHAMIEGWHGMALDKPLTRVKETTLLLRRMLTGEKTDFQGATVRSRGFTLSPPLHDGVPIFLAGLRRRMLEMAAEVGDGVVLNLVPLEHMPRMMETIAAGAARAGKAPEAVEVVQRFWICVADDPPAVKENIRDMLIGYFATPVYNQYMQWLGMADTAREIAEGFRDKDRDRTRAALNDDVLEQILIIGDRKHCHERIRAYIAAGVTTPLIHPLGPGFRETFEAFTPAAFPVK